MLKAKRVKVLDMKALDTDFYGIKIVGSGSPIFGALKGKGLISLPDKQEVNKLVRRFNKQFKLKGDLIIKSIQEHGDIQALVLDTE